MKKFSYIVPMYNSALYVERALLAITSVDHGDESFELIAVDNGSSDKTLEIANKYCTLVLVEPGVTISTLRNIGAHHASGEYLIFIDSDCVISQDWFDSLLLCIQRYPGFGVIGGYYGVGDNPTWVEQIWVALKKNISGRVSFLSAGTMVIKKKIFVSLKGFDPDLSTGEDWDLCYRSRKKGLDVICCPELSVRHLGNVKTLKQIVEKERWYGKGMFNLRGKIGYTKTYLATVFFIVCCLVSFVSFIVGGINHVGVASAALGFAIIVGHSLYFTRNINKSRVSYIFKMLPLSAAYLFGRSLSVLDYIKSKV